MSSDESDKVGRGESVSRRVMRGFRPDKLRELREGKELSRPDLARLAKVSVGAIGRWESGVRTPQIDSLARAADVLGATIADIVEVPPGSQFPGDWRILKGLTQPELGKRVTQLGSKVSTTTIGAIERGEVELQPGIAENLARVLDITVEELSASHERARLRPPGTPA